MPHGDPSFVGSNQGPVNKYCYLDVNLFSPLSSFSIYSNHSFYSYHKKAEEGVEQGVSISGLDGVQSAV